jgi:hypothetical protein
MILVVPAAEATRAVGLLEQHGHRARPVGEIVSGVGPGDRRGTVRLL